MKTECQAKLAEAIKTLTGDANRKLTQAELDGIETRIRSSMKSLSLNDPKFQQMNAAQRMDAAVKQAKQWMLEDMAAAHERSINEALKRKQQDDYISAAPAGQKLTALAQMLVHNPGSKVSAQSIEVRKMGVSANLKRKLGALLQYDHGKFFGVLQDPAKQHELMRALWGEKDVDPAAMQAAKVIHELNDHAVGLANEAGIPINRNDNWRLPQTQDPIKLAGRREEWVNDFKQFIDPRSAINTDGTRMNDAELTRWLNEVYDTLVTDGANKRAKGDGSGGAALVGSALNKPRQLYFKDADSYVAAMDKYGKTTNVYDLMSSHLDRIAKDVATAQVLGRQYKENFQRMFAQAQEGDALAAGGAKDARSVRSQAARIQRLFDALTAPDRPGNETVARTAANIRAVMGSSMLGGLFSNLPDVAMLKLAAHALDLPDFQMFRDGVKATFGGKGADDNAFALGVSLDAWRHAVNRFSEDTQVSGWAQFLNDATHRLAGVSAMDRGMRMAVSAGLMRKLGTLAQKFDRMDKLEAGDRELLQQWGLNQDHWSVLRKAGVDEDGKVTPALLDNLTHDDLRPLVDARLQERSQVFKDAIAQHEAASAKEQERLQKQADDYAAAKERALAWADTLHENAQRRMIGEQERLDARAELIRAQIARAEVEHDIATFVATQGAQQRVRGLMAAIEDGAAMERRTPSQPSIAQRSDRTIEQYGRGVNAKAEELGSRRAKAEARIEAAQTRVDELSRRANEKLAERERQIDSRFAPRARELANLADQFRDSAARRAEIIDEYQRRLGDAPQKETAALLNETQERLLSGVYNEMQTYARGGMGASVTDRVRLQLDRAQAGTASGEIWRFLTMFKSVPLGIFFNHWMDAPMKLDGAGSRAAYRAKFLLYSTLAGALAVQLKHMANGEDPENMDKAGFLVKSFAQGGGIGLYGDLLLHDASKTGSGDIAAVLGGPGLDLLKSVWNEYQTAKKEAADGGEHNYAASALKIVRQNFTPLMNIWYLKAAFNHLVYENLQDLVQPGYASDRGQRMQDQFGTTYWWGPNSTDGFNIMDRLPQRAPDLAAGWQPEQ